MADSAGSKTEWCGTERTGAPTSGGLLGIPLPILLALLGCAGLSLFLMRGVALSGDEAFYFHNSSHIAACLLGQRPGLTLAQCIDPIVGNGWFGPAMSLLLAPAHLPFGGEAPVAAVRAWTIAVNTSLLALIARALLRSGVAVGPVVCGVAASFLVPFYACFTGCLWGELVATHAAILLMLAVERRIGSWGGVTGVLSGAGIGLITLCRPQFFLLLALVAVRAMLAFSDGTIAGGRRLAVGLLATVAAWCAVVAPWQWAVTTRYGPFFLIVSTAEQPFVGDPNYRVNHRLTGPSWHAVHDHLVAEAARNGRSLSQQIHVSRKELTRLSFADRIRWQALQARRFYLDENKFLDRFHGLDHAHAVPDRAYAAVRSVNSVAWRAWMVVGLVLMVFPFTPGSNRDYRMPLLFKGLAGVVALQPIVYAAHGRYHVALIPIIAVFAAIALAAGSRAPGSTLAVRIVLTAVQAGAVAVVAATAFLLVCEV